MPEDTLLLYDEAMCAHDMGAWHPERPERLRAVEQILKAQPIAGVRWATPPEGDRAAVERVHGARYVARIESLGGRNAQLDPDTSMSPGSLHAAHLATGAAVEAVEAVVAGRARNTFALVRPPGHHAEQTRAMGFCLYNNIAIAAEHARAELGCERVLVIDWDVHHGNGTQHSFEDRADVLYFSLHHYPFFPGSGALDEVGVGDGRGYTVNVPLHGGCGDPEFITTFQQVLVPIADRFRPDIVLVSAGYDAHHADPLGGMRVTSEGYAALCGIALDIAARHAGGRLALFLEGGYDLAGLAASVRACVEVLAGATPPAPDQWKASKLPAVEKAIAFHRR